MYSGGLDSVGNLHRLLHDAKFEEFYIHVHHLSLQNIDRRAEAELMAVKKTLTYFSSNHEYREFIFTHSSHDYRFMNKYISYDTMWYAFMAANIMAADTSIKHVAVGRTRSDVESSASMEHAQRGHEVFFATLPPEIRLKRNYIYPIVHLSKKEIWDMLPSALRELSWSCRRPNYENSIAMPCGVCKACLIMKKIRHV